MTTIILLALGLGGLAAGILVGRYYVPDDRSLKRKARHADAYIQAINLMLDRDPDGAIALLVTVVAENVDDVEPYFALGALFRNRGEWERAIRVHQAIELRQKANRKLCLRARYQLGLDFRAAGMPRRATRAMEDCLEEDPKSIGALKALSSLYEEQGRFAEAAGAWAKIAKIDQEGDSKSIQTREHHLLCAAAQRAIERDDLSSAKQLLKDAGRIHEESPHFLVSCAELAAAKKNWDGASARLQQALSVQPELVSYLAGPLRAIELERTHNGTEEEGDLDAVRGVISVLRDVEQQRGEEPLLALAAVELGVLTKDSDSKRDFSDIVSTYPDFLPARVASARFALHSGSENEIHEQLQSLVGEQGVLESSLGGSWRCGNCQGVAEFFFWRCTSCRRWGTVQLDTSLARKQPLQVRRERRESLRAESKLRAGDSLPSASLETGLSDSDLSAAAERHTTLGRAGKWISSAIGSVRGTRKKSDNDIE